MWNIGTIYLDTNDFNNSERQNLTNVASSWEVYTDSRKRGQICVLSLRHCQQEWMHPLTTIY